MAKFQETEPGLPLDEMIDESTYIQLHCRARAILRGDNCDHGFEPGDLVNESFLRIARTGTLRLVGDRHHMIALVTLVMRRVLIDYARSVRSLKPQNRVALDFDIAMPDASVDDFAIRDVLERLAGLDGGLHRIVEMRYVLGLGLEEIAAALSTSSRTVKRRWRWAREWLSNELGGPPAASAGTRRRGVAKRIG
jgi:RNA polymerase sigma factor (TIGR02999 family)